MVNRKKCGAGGGMKHGVGLSRIGVTGEERARAVPRRAEARGPAV
jgi:hypothetical protein